MKITVRYFALLREWSGLEAEEVTWMDPDPTVERLREHLAARSSALREVLLGTTLLVAVNREYAAPGAVLRDGDEVALFPPVAGG